MFSYRHDPLASWLHKPHQSLELRQTGYLDQEEQVEMLTLVLEVVATRAANSAQEY